MIFSSYQFILIFLPIVFLVFRILIKNNLVIPAKVWLVGSSIVFYAQGDLRFTPIFLGTVIFNYIIGNLIINAEKKSVKRLILLVGLAENIALLGYFKYTNFFIENVNALLGSDYSLKTIILPLGISFFTFNIIGYIVDCYKDKASKYKFIDYMTFITFFPYLIMGPIVKHDQVISQLEDRNTFKFDNKKLELAIFLFAIGCAKKVIIADPLIIFAVSYYADPAAGGFLEAWTGMVAYTLAYYFDFSGYGDMAVALGLLFGVKLPFNFNAPYKARNFVDFWRRWNITLSNFLNEYIFNSVYRFGQREGKLFLGVMVTFLVSGIWHGAGWTYIVWGIFNGIFVFCAMFMTLHGKSLPAWLAHLLMIIGILFTRVLFDSLTLANATLTFKTLFDFGSIGNVTGFISENIQVLALIAIGTIIVFCAKSTMQLADEFKPTLKTAVWAGALLMFSLFFMSNVSGFLYFQF